MTLERMQYLIALKTQMNKRRETIKKNRERLEFFKHLQTCEACRLKYRLETGKAPDLNSLPRISAMLRQKMMEIAGHEEAPKSIVH